MRGIQPCRARRTCAVPTMFSEERNVGPCSSVGLIAVRSWSVNLLRNDFETPVPVTLSNANADARNAALGPSDAVRQSDVPRRTKIDTNDPQETLARRSTSPWLIFVLTTVVECGTCGRNRYHPIRHQPKHQTTRGGAWYAASPETSRWCHDHRSWQSGACGCSGSPSGHRASPARV
jgi:hypothetical protein